MTAMPEMKPAPTRRWRTTSHPTLAVGKTIVAWLSVCMYRYGAATCWIAPVLLFLPSVVSGNEPFGVPYTAGGTTAIPNPSLSVARQASEIDGIVAGKECRVLQVGRYVT